MALIELITLKIIVCNQEMFSISNDYNKIENQLAQSVNFIVECFLLGEIRCQLPWEMGML